MHHLKLAVCDDHELLCAKDFEQLRQKVSRDGFHQSHSSVRRVISVADLLEMRED